jgi:fimbrial chaperone protein
MVMRFQQVMVSVLASAAALWLPPASAGSFGISPLRLEMSGQVRTAVLTVRNDEDAPALIQVEALNWAQDDGQDRLDPTIDLLVSPTVFTLPPKGTQLVRVALRSNPDPTRELSYRVILQEVPPEASPDFTGLRVALRLSLPAFVAPTTTAKPDLAFSATLDANSAIVLRADNNGGAHARVLGLTLTPESGTGPVLQDSVATYVLPGQFRTWTLQNNNKTRDDSTASAARYRLKANMEQGEVVAELTPAR